MTTNKKLSEHLRQRTQEWLRKADHELAFLAVAPLDGEDPPTDTAGKMAHMAVEYSLKAYLMLNKHKITRSHDLVELLDECLSIRQDKEFEVLRSACQILTQYRVDFVYPGSAPEMLSVAEAQQAIIQARQIRDFIERKVQQLGF